ncbi:MAG: SusC/RagA family TonB-linked outer membrane protein, partial [Mangrovibacterium sp.]|nr:SusC/RagA family TonB-linked outer membrane protein [Mangrovibacterium sp.]
MTKLSLFILLLSLFSANASVFSQNSRLNLDYRNVSLKEVLGAIEDQSEYRFAFSSEYLDLNRKVSVRYENGSVTAILDNIFKETRIKYSMKDRVIILFQEGAGEIGVLQQSFKVSGRVTDSSGDPLPGVSVLIKGTTRGTVTGTDGSYTLGGIPDDGILQFSFIGMDVQEIAVTGRSRIDIRMVETRIGLEEVVAVGYGTQKKMNLTGSVVKVDGEELAKQTVTSAAQAIQGRVTGVEVVRNSGTPGAAATIRIRGVGTFGDASPLVIIDGIEGSINQLSPQEIESINILKDASACAIYGARAANGVIIVTTKSGKSGTSKINYNASVGINQAIRIPGRLNAREFVLLQNEALINASMTPFYSDQEMAGFGEGTDWVDEILRTGIRQNHNLQFSGGSDKLRYSLIGD